jgi:hypothetical protein
MLVRRTPKRGPIQSRGGCVHVLGMLDTDRGGIRRGISPGHELLRRHIYESAPNRDPARDWTYHVDSMPQSAFWWAPVGADRAPPVSGFCDIESKC